MDSQKINIFFAFIFYIGLIQCFIFQKGIIELEIEEFNSTLKEFNNNNTLVVFALTGLPCIQCEMYIHFMQTAYLYIGNDLDKSVVFINANLSHNPYIIESLGIKSFSYPEIYIMKPSNYTVEKKSQIENHYQLLNHINDYFPEKVIYLENSQEMLKRLKYFSENSVLGLFHNNSSELFIQYMNTAKKYTSIKYYFSYNITSFQDEFEIETNESDSINIIKNPHLLKKKDEYEIRTIEANQTSEEFLLSNFLNIVDICSPPVFKIYRETNSTALIFFSSPKHSRSEITNLTIDIEKVAKKVPKLKFCVSLNGFDSPTSKAFDIKRSGEVVIITPNQTIYKKEDENMYKKMKLNKTSLIEFIKDYNKGKLTPFVRENETSDIYIVRGVEFIDSKKKFTDFTTQSGKFLCTLSFYGSIEKSLVSMLNDVYRNLDNLTEVMKIGIIDTKMFNPSEEYLKFGKHNIILFVSPKKEVVSYRGQRDYKSILNSLNNFVEDYYAQIKKIKENQKKYSNPQSEL